MTSITVSNGCSVGLVGDELNQAFVEVVAGICGGGKSHAMIEYIMNELGVTDRPSSRFIIAAKTDKLCEHLQERLPLAVVINTDSLNMRKKRNQEFVTGAVCKAVKSYQHRVIIITHAALERLASRLHYDSELRDAMRDCQVMIDEAPDGRKQVSAYVRLDYVDSVPWFDYTMIKDGLMYATRVDKLRHILRAGDTRSAQMLIALINGDKVRVKEVDSNTLQLSCLARSDVYVLSRFCRVCILGANILNSPIVRTGLRRGFLSGAKESDVIRVPDDRRTHKRTDRVNFGHLLDVRASKRNIKKYADDIADRVIEVMKRTGKPFLFTCNADEPGAEGFKFKTFFTEKFTPYGGKWIAPKAHGQNKFADHDCAVWLCSLRFKPDVIDEYDDKEEAHSVESWETLDGCYQFLSRTGIRKQDSVTGTESFTFLVLDAEQADYCTSNYFHDAVPVADFEPIHVEVTTQQERGRKMTSKTVQAIQSAVDMLKLSGVKVTQSAVAKQAGMSRMTVSRNWSEVNV